MFSLIYTVASNKKEANKISEVLIKEKLAACCNIFSIESIYRWPGRIEKGKEFGIFVKTKTKLMEKIIKRIKEIHSYQVPCIISFKIGKGYKPFLNWIRHSVQ